MATIEDKLYRALKILISQCVDSFTITKAPTPKQLSDAVKVKEEYEKVNDKIELTDELKKKIAEKVSKSFYPAEYILAKQLMVLGFDELDCYKFVFKNTNIDWEARDKIDKAFRDIKHYPNKLNKIPQIIIEIEEQP